MSRTKIVAAHLALYIPVGVLVGWAFSEPIVQAAIVIGCIIAIPVWGAITIYEWRLNNGNTK